MRPQRLCANEISDMETKAHTDTDSSSIGIARPIRRILYYGIAICLVISSNSLWALQGNGILGLSVLLVALEGVLVLMLWSSCGISKRFLAAYVVWVLIVALVFAVVIAFGGLDGAGRWLAILALLIATPLLLHLLALRGELWVFFRAFVNVVVVMAALSTGVWMLGPMTHVLQPDCAIMNTWVSGGTVAYLVPGYHHLLYLVQSTDIGTLIWRNTGIFPEAPMFSFVLTCAFTLELCLSERPRAWVLAMLTFFVATSVSTTGLLVVIAGIVGGYYVRLQQRGTGVSLRTFVLIGFILVAALVAFQLLDAKLASSSGSTRSDDYVAGFKAWLDSPVVGHGFGGYESIARYFSLFRGNNTGFSNSPMHILALGGLVLFTVFLMGLIGLFLGEGLKSKLLALLFALMFILTIISSLPLCALFISLGVTNLIELLSEDRIASTGRG